VPVFFVLAFFTLQTRAWFFSSLLAFSNAFSAPPLGLLFAVCGLIADERFDLYFDMGHASPQTLRFVDKQNTLVRAPDAAGTEVEDALSIQPLLDELGDRWQYSWIKQRLRMMWPEINLAARHVTNTTSCNRSKRSRLRVSNLSL